MRNGSLPPITNNQSDPLAQPQGALVRLYRARIFNLLIVNAVILAQFAGPQCLYIIYPALALWALRGPREAIQALSLAWIPGLVNPVIFPVPYFIFGGGSDLYTALRWLVILSAFVSVSLRAVLNTIAIPRIFVLLLYFFIATLPGALMVSVSPILSLIKFASFTMGFVAVVLAFKASKSEHNLLAGWFFDIAIVIVAWNVALLFDDAAYRARDALYQGLFSHPQITGAVIALIMAWVAGNAAISKSSGWQSWLVLAGGGAVLLEAGSRTAAYSLVLGFGIAAMVAVVLQVHWRREIYAAVRKTGVISLCVLLGIIVAIILNGGGDRIRDFVVKRETALGAPIETTRPFKISEQWLAFEENPLIGNGFGVPSVSAGYYYAISGNEGFTLSAPIEKNFMPTAVLEEVGILGASVFVVFLFGMIWPIIQYGSFAAGWLAFAVILSNLGEISFFSFGGIGLFVWLMFALARNNISYSVISFLPDYDKQTDNDD